MIGKFSELPYHTKALRGMRTSRLRKMSADADALRRENPALQDSYLFRFLIDGSKNRKEGKRADGRQE